MVTRYKSSPEDEQLVQDEGVDHLERESAIKRLAFDQIYEMEPVFARLLRHSSPFIRSAALNSLLAYWKKAEYLSSAIQMLHDDPEWMVRADAAFALSQFAQNKSKTSRDRKLIVHELARALMRNEEWGVQKRCYQQLLKILAPERDYVELPNHFDRDRDVDWELLKPYLDQQPA